MKKVSIVNWGNKYISGGGESAANAIKEYFDNVGADVKLYYCDNDRVGSITPGKHGIRTPFYYLSSTADTSFWRHQKKRVLKWGSVLLFELVVSFCLLLKKEHNVILGEAFFVGFILSLLSKHKVILRLHGPIKSKIQKSLVRKNITLVANGSSFELCRQQFPNNVILDLDPPLPSYFGITRVHRAEGTEIDPLTVAYIGRFEHIKGFDLLPDYFERLSESVTINRTFLVGDGTLSSLLPEFNDLCRNIGIQSLGPLGRKDVAKLLADEVDLLILPSRQDNSPNVIREAVASGVPIAVSEGVFISHNIDKTMIYSLDNFELERFKSSRISSKLILHTSEAVGDSWSKLVY
jgi:glycosyltransferase involved in cell wall biosynthesis